jgi:lysophospholipase L1-like esterase
VRAFIGFLFLLSVVRGDVTVATVGDSLADSVYLGIKSQPNLIKQHGIHLIRWSRPSIGLTRTDLFDYAEWLRTSKEVTYADFCIVEMGANDLQSISVGHLKWTAVGSERWRKIYRARQESMLRDLKPRRCGEVVWLLQSGYPRNKYLSQYHEMINTVQLSGLQSSSTAAFEILASPEDYGNDGIHFNGPFCLKLGQAVLKVFESWRHYSQNCSSCHPLTDYSFAEPKELVPLALIPGR